MFGNVRHRNARKGAGNEKVDANRWCDEAYRQVDDHDDTEVNRIDTKGGDNRKQYRRQNQDRRCGVHDHAHYEQEHIDANQNRNFGRKGRGNGCSYNLWYLHQRQNPSEAKGCRNDKEDWRVGGYTFRENLDDLTELHGFVNEETDKERIVNGYDSGFSW